MAFADRPDKKQKHPHYEHKAIKLYNKKNQFTIKEFHRIRKDSTHKNLISSFSRISMCLNGKDPSKIPIRDLDKVCFILINTYEDTEDDLGVGPLNDGYIIGSDHHNLGFKVFYLYNPNSNEFLSHLNYFIKNVTKSLTIYYSGADSIDKNGIHGIQFIDTFIPSSQISILVCKECNPKVKVIFLSDCRTGGSIFDVDSMMSDYCANPLIILSFFANKDKISKDNKDMKRSHGIFTYYFCNIISETPNITPASFIERVNTYILRFNELAIVESTKPELFDSPIFE